MTAHAKPTRFRRGRPRRKGMAWVRGCLSCPLACSARLDARKTPAKGCRLRDAGGEMVVRLAGRANAC